MSPLLQEAQARLQPQLRWLRIVIGAVLILGVAVGSYLFGVRTSQPKPEVVTAVPQVRQADGSVIAQRHPVATATKPPHKIPRNAVEERRITLKVQPPNYVSPTGCQCDPSPLDVNLSLVREDGGRRVIASSPEGKILTALDVPIEAVLIPEAHPWSAGLSVGDDKSPGVWIERDLGRFRVGAEAIRAPSNDLSGRVRIGFNW